MKLEDDVKSKLAKVVEGNVLEENSVREAIKGSDGVVVVLGTRNDLSKFYVPNLYVVVKYDL